jgi:antirestriction protein
VSEGHQREQEQPAGEHEPSVKPQVWIVSLSDYNGGHLHGSWVDADQEPDGIWDRINEILRTAPDPGAEEWAIFDHEGFGALQLSEYESVERISKLGRGVAEHGEAFAAFANFLGPDEDELLEQFEDCYQGRWQSTEAYTENLLGEVGVDQMLDETVPESLRPYVRVDVETLARDMECEGSLLAVEASEGGLFLFHPPR